MTCVEARYPTTKDVNKKVDKYIIMLKKKQYSFEQLVSIMKVGLC